MPPLGPEALKPDPDVREKALRLQIEGHTARIHDSMTTAELTVGLGRSPARSAIVSYRAEGQEPDESMHAWLQVGDRPNTVELMTQRVIAGPTGEPLFGMKPEPRISDVDGTIVTRRNSGLEDCTTVQKRDFFQSVLDTLTLIQEATEAENAVSQTA